MKSPPKVLQCGRVIRLLDTRRIVLESAGFLVSISTDINEVGRVIKLHDPDLLILCHTLSNEEKAVALATVRTTRPQLPTLTLAKTYVTLITQNASEVLPPIDGPADLIAVAKAVFNRCNRNRA